MVEPNQENNKQSSPILESLLKKLRKIFSHESTTEQKPLSSYLTEIEKISREVYMEEQIKQNMHNEELSVRSVTTGLQEENQLLRSVLNEVFKIGEPIDVFDGKMQIGQTGIFLYANEKFLLWINHNDEISVQLLEGSVCFQTAKKENIEEKSQAVIVEDETNKSKKKLEFDELMMKMISLRDEIIEKNY